MSYYLIDILRNEFYVNIFLLYIIVNYNENINDIDSLD